MAMEEVTKMAIVQMYEQGATMEDIAVEVDYSIKTIRRVLKQAGLLTESDGVVRLEDRYDEASTEAIHKDYYEIGMKVRDIIRKWNFANFDTFYIFLHQKGWTARRYTKTASLARKLRMDQAIELYQQGMPIWQITEETGVDQPSLHHEIHHRRIPLRKRMMVEYDHGVTGKPTVVDEG